VSDASSVSVGPRRTGPPPWAVALGFGVLVVAGLLWAKWAPYWVKVPSVAGSHSLGPSILTGGEPAPPGVSPYAGLRFAGTYFLAIWPALVVGLVLAAAVQVALPSAWLARLFGSGVRGGVRGSALAVPSMMCSCCAAPLTVGLRRRAGDLTATLAYFPVGSTLLTGTGIVLGVVLLAVAGTLLPIPTGAEIAVVAALLAVGVSGPLAAALLITLPALSLPSLLMVRGVFPRGLLVAVTGLVSSGSGS